MLEEKQLPWRELLEAVARRRGWVVVVTAIGFIMALLSAFAEPPVYRATATLELTPARGSLEVNPGADSAVSRAKISQQDLQQQIALLQRPTLVRAVLAARGEDGSTEESSGLATSVRRGLGYITGPSRFFERVYSWIHQTPNTDPVEVRIAKILSQVEIESLGRSNLLLFSYSDRSPDKAAEIVNGLLMAHVERRVGSGEESTQAREFYLEQRQVLEARIFEAREELDRFRTERGVSDLPTNGEGLEDGLGDLRDQEAIASTALQEVVAKIAFLRREIEKQPARIKASVVESESESVARLRSHLLDLELERTNLLSRYAQGSTVIRDIERRIADLETRLQNEETTTAETRTVVNSTRQSLELQLIDAQAQEASLRARVAGLRGQISDRRVNVRRLQAVAPQLTQLENKVASATSAYKNYLRKEEEARFAQALDESRIFNLRVIEPALPPTRPEAGGRLLKVLLATIVAGSLGLVLALARDWIDPTLKGARQAERVSGLPVIAEIPS